MTRLLKTHGTTFTVVLFFVSAVSGVALFFHWAPAAFHGMHEWLSLVLIVPVAVHLWRNWNAFTTYFKRRTLLIPAVLGVVASLVFAWPAMTSGAAGGGNPMRAAISAIEGATIAEAAPLFDLAPADLGARLVARGYALEQGADFSVITLFDLAKASGKPGGPALVADVAFTPAE